jgi:hypothetical protein
MESESDAADVLVSLMSQKEFARPRCYMDEFPSAGKHITLRDKYYIIPMPGMHRAISSSGHDSNYKIEMPLTPPHSPRAQNEDTLKLLPLQKRPRLLHTIASKDKPSEAPRREEEDNVDIVSRNRLHELTGRKFVPYESFGTKGYRYAHHLLVSSGPATARLAAQAHKSKPLEDGNHTIHWFLQTSCPSMEKAARLDKRFVDVLSCFFAPKRH